MSALITFLLLIAVVSFTFFYSVDLFFNNLFAGTAARAFVEQHTFWFTAGAGIVSLIALVISFSAIFTERGKTMVFGSKKMLVVLVSVSFLLVAFYAYKLFLAFPFRQGP